MRFIMLMLTMLASGCASEATNAPAAPITQPIHATCLVCKHNADLACVDVDVTPTTPTASYNGQTYYFCSDECRNEFLKHAEHYARR